MPLAIKDILDIIKETTEKRGSPVPLPIDVVTGWVKNLNIPRGGDTVLYTGQLYQMVPYINRYVHQLEKISATTLKLAKVAGKFLDLSMFIEKPSQEEIERQHTIIRNIAKLLLKLGVRFGYLYEDDMYSGVLLYDLGLYDTFINHAKKVYHQFKKYNVKHVITIDPHTTNILRKVYPEYIENFDLDVVNYIEVLAEKELNNINNVNKNVVIHDSCIYARSENIIKQPRELLSKIGITVLEPPRNKNLTFCCGGPIEMLFPELSHRVAETRMKELQNVDRNIVVACPICYANLSRVAQKDVDVKDLSHYLALSLLGGSNES
jgi:Fe-S oxidoreductase